PARGREGGRYLMLPPSPRLKAARDEYMRALRYAIDAATWCGLRRKEAHRSDEAQSQFEAAHAEYLASRRALKEASRRLREAERAEWGEGPSIDLGHIARTVWRWFTE
ncbi:MAG: hypothetical protein OXU85_07570, partial [Thaumarchaeota archaeon]|nr:hypothetical protein [Nitrososphaerota archaeon]